MHRNDTEKTPQSYANPQTFSFSWQQYESQPVIDNMLGMVYEPGVKVEGTCALKYNGTMYILGGPPNSQDATQLLKVETLLWLNGQL